MSMLPVVPESHSHVLAEFDCLDPLLSALRLDSGRLKVVVFIQQCTCLAVSRKLLALGTSSGALHLIQREGWKHRLILTHKEGSITQVECCPYDEDFIAVATSQGLVVVWELHLERRGRPERVSVSWEHRGLSITSLCWDTSHLRVFVGDTGGKVSFLRAGSSKLGKGSAFVMFPVQTITTVDSQVVQLGYQEGRLLVSSLSRCYLCDTEREKFWRVGNKERDGEYGACFFPQSRSSTMGQPPLLYCARPGSRIWEASFDGEVLSTHQFKQLLACPPIPLISYRSEPYYNPAQKSSPSLAFPKLLYLGDQRLLTWRPSAIYIFTPQSGQVLLWTEVKDLVDIVVYRSELFCLHGDGRLCHLSLLSVERCVERLLRRESWLLAATVCCMFQHAIAPSRARKSITTDRLDHLKSQLSSTTHPELIGQMEEVILRLEPLNSASSSRRSSISSHESFNVLDCGIYRVISRRGSQSDEDTSSLVSQSMLEEERLKEFNFVQEDDQLDHASPSLQHSIHLLFSSAHRHNHFHSDPLANERVEGERSEVGLQFHLPLSFRPKPPRIALQAVCDSVSSFVKKTTEKINTLQMNSDLWPLPDHREGGLVKVSGNAAPSFQQMANDPYIDAPNSEADLNKLRIVTEQAICQVQDPLILLDPSCLGESLLEWLPVLERVLGPESPMVTDMALISTDGPTEERWNRDQPNVCFEGYELSSVKERLEPFFDDKPREDIIPDPKVEEDIGDCNVQAGLPEGERVAFSWSPPPPEPVQIDSPIPLPAELQADLSQLATLYLELACFGNPVLKKEGSAVGVTTFLCRYFFLLDQERVRRMCLLCYQDIPEVQSAFIEAMLDVTRASKVVEVIQRGDLLKSLRSLRELQPWKPPQLLAHLHRLYEKHGELALRSFAQFYPAILLSDIMVMAQKSHFLAYLDNLLQSQADEQRLSFLGSLLQPESLRQDWLELALTHDAPLQSDTLTIDGQPRWHSHFFRWGYGRLLSLLICLPADLSSKQKMAETCRSHGYWTGYMSLCCDLQRRTEAFSTICYLDDISLLEESNCVEPQTLEEWKLLIKLSQKINSGASSAAPASNGSGLANGSANGCNQVSPENLTLRLARVVGPDQALVTLQDCGVEVALTPHSIFVCELLRVSEKRQRALIQTMLERCDRFLWSQHA